jgi:S1-C subfamily serine protease
VSVPSKGARPAGIALRGIGRLGIGLRDGDVLTHVSGRRVKTSEDVVTLVLGLRGRQVARINAVFWRAGKPWRLIVEQPYLQGVEP